jgi:hypothetical protein
MSRISIGTWAYCVGPYMNNPIPFGDVVKELKRLGFDGFEFVLDKEGEEQKTLASNQRSQIAEKRKPCYWAWNTTVVGWDGAVQPCCMQVNEIPLLMVVSIWYLAMTSVLYVGQYFIERRYGRGFSRQQRVTMRARWFGNRGKPAVETG